MGVMLTSLRARVVSVWPFAAPAIALVLLAVFWGGNPSAVAAVACACALGGVVFAAVVHAEAIAHRVGEPYGTLVLALAITVIEVSLIVVLMLEGGPKAETLARDTVFAAVMIVCNGVLGGAFLINALRTHLVRFSQQGANALLATLLTLASLTMVIPAFAGGEANAASTGAQLVFAAAASLGVYVVFVFVQTGRHRWMFLDPDALKDEADDTQAHVVPHTARSHRDSLAVRGVALVASLVGVVGLAKTLSPRIEDAVSHVGAPLAFVGVLIALLVLLPESVTAFRAAARNEMQTSINLALGSGAASIGLTVPVIAVASAWLAIPVTLALGPAEIALLATTAVVAVLSFGSGKATVLQAALHLGLFAAFVFLALTS